MTVFTLSKFHPLCDRDSPKKMHPSQIFSQADDVKHNSATSDASELLKAARDLPPIPELKFSYLEEAGLKFCNKWTDPPVGKISLRATDPPPLAVSSEFLEWLRKQRTAHDDFTLQVDNNMSEIQQQKSTLEEDKDTKTLDIQQQKEFRNQLKEEMSTYEEDTQKWKTEARERENILKDKWVKLQDWKDHLNRLRKKVYLTCTSLVQFTDEFRTDYQKHLQSITFKKEEFNKKHDDLFSQRKQVEQKISALQESITYQESHILFLEKQQSLLRNDVEASVTSYVDKLRQAYTKQVHFLQEKSSGSTSESKMHLEKLIFTKPYYFKSTFGKISTQIQLQTLQSKENLTHDDSEGGEVWEATEVESNQYTLSTVRFENDRLVKKYLSGTDSTGCVAILSNSSQKWLMTDIATDDVTSTVVELKSEPNNITLSGESKYRISIHSE